MKRLSRTSLGGETSSASASGGGAASSSAEDGVAREASFVVRDALGDKRCSLTADGRVLSLVARLFLHTLRLMVRLDLPRCASWVE